MENSDAKRPQISDNTDQGIGKAKSLVYSKLILFFFMAALSLLGDAATLSDINVGRVPIDDQSSITQSKAGREALRQVFIKMSGHEQTVNEPEIRRAISNYEQYLIASSFVQQQAGLMFEARFNEDKLIALLKATGLPVWASLRPSATLWFAQLTSTGDIRWLTQNTAATFNQTLQQLAFERGVGIVLPMGDLNDAMAISAFDVWTQNTSKLIAQSTRYDTPATISATLRPITATMREQYLEEANFLSQQQALERLLNGAEGGQVADMNKGTQLATAPTEEDEFQLDWIISSGQPVIIGKQFLTSADQAPLILVNEYADSLAQRYAVTAAVSASEARNIILSMQNIHSLSDYNQVLALVNTMPQVNDVRLSTVRGATADFAISLNGNSEDFTSLLVLDKRVNMVFGTADTEQNIQLIWQR